MSEPAIIRIIKEIPEKAYNGPHAIGEEMVAIEGYRTKYGKIDIVALKDGTKRYPLTADEYELVSGEIPMITTNSDPVTSGAYPRNPQQVRMNKAARTYAKRAGRGNTVQY